MSDVKREVQDSRIAAGARKVHQAVSILAGPDRGLGNRRIPHLAWLYLPCQAVSEVVHLLVCGKT